MSDFLETTVDKFTFKVATDRFYTRKASGQRRKTVEFASDCLILSSSAAGMWPLQRSSRQERSLLQGMKWRSLKRSR